jgi:hypothetical protein
MPVLFDCFDSRVISLMPKSDSKPGQFHKYFMFCNYFLTKRGEVPEEILLKVSNFIHSTTEKLVKPI